MIDKMTWLLREDIQPTCVECHRTFDLTDEEDANEFHYGHDSETEVSNA